MSTDINLNAGPVRRYDGDGVFLETWMDAFGQSMTQRIRANGKIVGLVFSGAYPGGLCIITERKWVAKLFADWLGLPMVRTPLKHGGVNWRVQHPGAAQGEIWLH